MMTFLTALVPLTFALLYLKRAARYLHIFQQEEYDAPRFLKWIVTSFSIDKRLTGLLVTLLIVPIFYPAADHNSTVFNLIISAAFIMSFWIEPNPLKDGKKPLVATVRAKRILMVGAVIEALTVMALTYTQSLSSAAVWLAAIHAIPFSLIIANIVLSPMERMVKATYRAEAVALLNQYKPTVIGITGSFGKTSVKHMLGHVLGFHAPTLFTPGSVNTEMGIVRIIREQLKAQHTYFIVEMGAYGIGSIARLCHLTPPSLSLITAIGQAHYERFKTLNDTARAKFEIAEAAIAQNGHVIIHESVLDQTYAADFYKQHHDNITKVGPHADVTIHDVAETKTGIQFHLTWKGSDYHITTPLYGLHHVGNVALTFVAAAQLGMAPEHIVMALRSVPQVKHRLEVKHFADHILIDDAYNSNPAGFASALNLLNMLGTDTRRILVTPGMVEMGADHDSAHYTLGVQSTQCADIVLVVSPTRIPSFIKAFREHANEAQILLTFETFLEAQAWLTLNKQHGDVILLENDLPDVYERRFPL